MREAASSDAETAHQLGQPMGQLGQVLAERFDQEDALIWRLHMPRRKVA